MVFIIILSEHFFPLTSGTGKSQVIVSLIKELYFTQLRSVLPEKFKILIVSNSDKEADDLLNRILNVNKKGKIELVSLCSILLYRYECFYLIFYLIVGGDLVNILRFFGNCDTTRNNVCECTVHQKALDEIKRNINLIDMNEEVNYFQFVRYHIAIMNSELKT